MRKRINPTHLTLIACIAIALPTLADTNAPPAPNGAYYSAQRPWMPPLPFHPFPELPAVEVESKRYVYDDTLVNYDLLRAELLMMGPPAPGGAGGSGTNAPPPYLPPTVPIPGVPLLKIETLDGAQIASFNTRIGFIYRLEQVTSLSSPVWQTVEEFVATETNASFVIDAGATGFYRVWQDSDTIQFPDWFDNIYQFMEFTAYTPVTSGTIAVELYADGELIFDDLGPIPTGGMVRVYDPNYDPAEWPNTGYYGVSEWEFRVTVTQTAGAAGSTHKIVRKKGIQRNPPGTYYGKVVGQGGIFNTTTAQEEVDYSLWFCMLGMYQACEIVDWNFNEVDMLGIESWWMTANATLFGPPSTSWPLLRTWITRNTPSNTLADPYLDYFHYMGHGSPKSIGSGANAATFITLQHLKDSPYIKTNYLTYVALDGCRTSKSQDFLAAFTGQKTKRTRLEFAAKGENPHFGCGWNNVKTVEWILQGQKVDNHFYFWEDFYFDLTRRNPNGLMYRGYKDAYGFAKEPKGQGVNNVLQANAEANGFEYVGCENCRFDERPGIVQ